MRLAKQQQREQRPGQISAGWDLAIMESILASSTVGLIRYHYVIDAIVISAFLPVSATFSVLPDMVNQIDNSVLMAAIRDPQHKENFGSVADGLGSAIIFHNYPKHQ
jgi:hypothetical protein